MRPMGIRAQLLKHIHTKGHGNSILSYCVSGLNSLKHWQAELLSQAVSQTNLWSLEAKDSVAI